MAPLSAESSVSETRLSQPKRTCCEQPSKVEDVGEGDVDGQVDPAK